MVSVVSSRGAGGRGFLARNPKKPFPREKTLAVPVRKWVGRRPASARDDRARAPATSTMRRMGRQCP